MPLKRFAVKKRPLPREEERVFSRVVVVMRVVAVYASE